MPGGENTFAKSELRLKVSTASHATHTFGPLFARSATNDFHRASVPGFVSTTRRPWEPVLHGNQKVSVPAYRESPQAVSLVPRVLVTDREQVERRQSAQWKEHR